MSLAASLSLGFVLAGHIEAEVFQNQTLSKPHEFQEVCFGEL